MEGLNKGDNGFLNGLIDEPIEKRREPYTQFRQKYRDEPLALEQIDVYDMESPYRQHWRFYRDAIHSGDVYTLEIEQQWLMEHYPLMHKYRALHDVVSHTIQKYYKDNSD